MSEYVLTWVMDGGWIRRGSEQGRADKTVWIETDTSVCRREHIAQHCETDSEIVESMFEIMQCLKMKYIVRFKLETVLIDNLTSPIQRKRLKSLASRVSIQATPQECFLSNERIGSLLGCLPKVYLHSWHEVHQEGAFQRSRTGTTCSQREKRERNERWSGVHLPLPSEDEGQQQPIWKWPCLYDPGLNRRL